ncbi:hypothetical protein FQN54_002408 [Arachnomyces sp. PD_36]|nr:hypothetical protein FQN54_002408 [Arachnomyces sp. PD_36]
MESRTEGDSGTSAPQATLHLQVGKTPPQRVQSVEELDKVFNHIHGSGTGKSEPVLFNCRMISYHSAVSKPLLDRFFDQYRRICNDMGRALPTRMTSHSSPDPVGFPASFDGLVCQCESCSNGTPCGQAFLMADVWFFKSDDTDPTLDQIHDSAGMQRVLEDVRVRNWAELSSNQARIDIHRSGEAFVRECKKICFYRDTTGRTIQFIYGQNDGSQPQRTMAECFKSHVEALCRHWDYLLTCLKGLLSDASRDLLSNTGRVPKKLLRSITAVADISAYLQMVHRQQYDAIKQFTRNEEEEGKLFQDFEGSRDDGSKGSYLQPSLERLRGIGDTVDNDLVKKADALFQRASNIMSIDEAYESREQNASLKRLSWITFIFLPLLFVASLYGMNVDVLKDNPAWTTYFYVAVPVFALVLLSVPLIKYFKPILRVIKLIKLESLRNNAKADEENQLEAVDELDRDEFFAAIRDGMEGLVDYFLRNGIDVNIIHPKYGTPLQEAAASGHLKIVERLLKENAEVNRPAIVRMNNRIILMNGRTPLQAAAGGGHLEIVERLLKEKADVNASAAVNGGRTALQAAAGGGHLEIVERLLKEKAEVNASGAFRKGRTALQAAAGGGHLEIVERLLKEKAEVNAPAAMVDGRTALQAAQEAERPDVVDRLLRAGARIDSGPK